MSDFKIYLDFNDEFLNDSNLIKVDVKAKNVPKDLFGVSFYLRIDGDGWNLNKFEVGDVFSGVDPMVLVSSNDKDVIVSGISLKFMDEAFVNDGVLLSFYIDSKFSGVDGDLLFKLYNGVASSLDSRDGVSGFVRKDFDSTIFDSSVLGVFDHKSNLKIYDKNIKNGDEADDKIDFMLSEVDGDFLEGEVSVLSGVDILHNEKDFSAAGFGVFDVVFFLLIFCVFVVGGFVLFLKFKKGGFNK